MIIKHSDGGVVGKIVDMSKHAEELQQLTDNLEPKETQQEIKKEASKENTKPFWAHE